MHTNNATLTGNHRGMFDSQRGLSRGLDTGADASVLGVSREWYEPFVGDGLT